MQVPSLLLGRYNDVKKRCRTTVRSYVRATHKQPWLEMLEKEGMLDTKAHSGLLVLDGPDIATRGEIHFHCYVPLRLLLDGIDPHSETLNPQAVDEIHEACLERPWSLLGMLSMNSLVWWLREQVPDRVDRCYRYTKAVLRYWDSLDGQGARYSWGASRGERLWNGPLALKHALAVLGVPPTLIRQPLPPAGLYALLAEADRSRGGDLVELGKSVMASDTQSVERSAAHTSEGAYRQAHTTESDGTFASRQMVTAMRANDPMAVRRLIESGESISAFDPQSLRSPLLWAAENGHTELILFLLDKGAYIEDRADEGESPLMLAAFRGHADAVRLLLERGADPFYRTEKGLDALDFAELGEHAAVIALIEEVQSR